MFRKANNVFSVILDDVDQSAAGLPAVGSLVTDVNLGKGAVVLVDAGNLRLNAAAFATLADGEQFRILQGKGVGQPLMKSPILTKGKVKLSIAKHKEAVQQVTIIGYNGTTGALPVANNTDFWIKIRKRDNDAANRSQPMSLFAGPVKTDATGTQKELAFALAINGTKNFALQPANHYLKFEVISDTLPASFGLVDVVNGSRQVLNDTTGAGIGDVLTITDATTGTSAAYLVVDAVGTTLTLNYAYQGTTETAAAADANPVAGTNFGVRLTGIQAPFNVNSFRDYYANRFTATFSDSTTLVTHAQGAYNGNGMFQQVALDEYMSYGFEGQNGMLGVPPQLRDQEVKIPGVTAGVTALDAKYSALDIAWEEDIKGLVSKSGGQGNVLFYVNLNNVSGTGFLTGTNSTGLELVTALGLSGSPFNE